MLGVEGRGSSLEIYLGDGTCLHPYASYLLFGKLSSAHPAFMDISLSNASHRYHAVECRRMIGS
jgi:hypothetical protein